jgi:undecaprenyl-diphosphatase
VHLDAPVIAWLVVAAFGAVIVLASVAVARHPVISPQEARLFHAVNRLPGWLYVPLWLPMQLGNLVVGLLAGLLVALLDRNLVIAMAVVVATLLKLVTERFIRRQMAEQLAVRQRPGTSQTGAVLRGRDVPATGPSFPSGHVILAFAIACIVATPLRTEFEVSAFLLAVLVAVGRVYVGAHNPLDVTAGLGAGLLVGGLLAAVVAA